MSSSDNKDNNVYIKADKAVKVSDKSIKLGDVVKLYGTDKKLIKHLNGLNILNLETAKKQTKSQKHPISILKIIECIHRYNPTIPVQNIGENEFIIEYVPPGKKKIFLEIVKVVIVCLTTFFGSAFTIMTFNQDVNIADVFSLLYSLAGLGEGDSVIMEIGYSIGLPLGIILFYNHFSKVKLGSDPTPLQTQMRIYEEDTDQTVVRLSSRKGDMIDAD